MDGTFFLDNLLQLRTSQWDVSLLRYIVNLSFALLVTTVTLLMKYNKRDPPPRLAGSVEQ